jgi:hypothetical protein
MRSFINFQRRNFPPRPGSGNIASNGSAAAAKFQDVFVIQC